MTNRIFWWRVEAWTLKISLDLYLVASDLLLGEERVALAWAMQARVKIDNFY